MIAKCLVCHDEPKINIAGKNVYVHHTGKCKNSGVYHSINEWERVNAFSVETEIIVPTPGIESSVNSDEEEAPKKGKKK